MDQWYCIVGGQQYGPVSMDILGQWIRQGRLRPNDYIWTQGMDNWAPAGSVKPELFTGASGIPPAFGMVLPVPGGGASGQTLNAELTRRARQSLRGNWGTPIAFSLLLGLLTVGINMAPYVGGLAGVILAGPFQLGAVIFYITFARGGPVRLGMMFDGFKRFGRALAAYLLVGLLVALWTVLASLPGLLILASGENIDSVNLMILGGVLTFVGACVALIVASLRYSQTFYILADQTTPGALAAISGSKQMMHQSKWKLFCLYWRFFGWYLLCLLTLGIGLLWVVPYVSVSIAKFYDDLHPPAAQQNTPITSPPDQSDMGASAPA